MIERSTNIRAALRARQRGFLLNPFRYGSGGGGGADPHFSNVTLLMHGDGVDGQTTTVDSSSYARAIASAGTTLPTLSAAQKKFGPTSMRFGGGGDSAFTVASSADTQFGTGDFTVELWVYAHSVSGGPFAISNRSGGSGGLGWYLQASSSNSSWEWGWDGGGFTIGLAQISAWQHLAVCRSAGVLYAFRNGVRTASTPAHTVNYSKVGRVLAVGRDNSSGNNLNGYIDDLRITKGVARYLANFTPPAAAFPDS